MLSQALYPPGKVPPIVLHVPEAAVVDTQLALIPEPGTCTLPARIGELRGRPLFVPFVLNADTYPRTEPDAVAPAISPVLVHKLNIAYVPTLPKVVSTLNEPLDVTVPVSPFVPDPEVTVPTPAVLALANAEVA